MVRRAVDGDTVQLADGRLVRYIGLDAPELRRRADGGWVWDPEPFGEQAAGANRWLVEGRTIRLEYDVQLRDRFGRLLAYVYVETPTGELMVNAKLLEDGLAQLLTIPPNVRYADRFRELAAQARTADRGLWSRER